MHSLFSRPPIALAVLMIVCFPVCRSTAQTGSPSFTSAGSKLFITSEQNTFSVVVNGISNPVITEAGSLPSGVTFQDNHNGMAVLSGIPQSGTENTYPITFTAADAANTISITQNFTLTVASLPVFTSSPSGATRVLLATDIPIVVTGVPAPNISLSSKGAALPKGLSLGMDMNGKLAIIGTPAVNTQGTHTVVFVATNVAGTAEQSFNLTVETNPYFVSENTASFMVDTAGTFNVVTDGDPAAAIRLKSGVLPKGITFVDQGGGKGLLSGTPLQGTAGAYPLLFSAQNSVSTALQAFTLQIGSDPSFTSPAKAVFTAGVAGEFSVTTNHSSITSAPVLKIDSGSLPSGLTFVNNGDGTATIAGTPASGDGGPYPVTLLARSTYPSASGTKTVTATQQLEIQVNQPSSTETKFVFVSFSNGKTKSFTLDSKFLAGTEYVSQAASGTVSNKAGVITYTPNGFFPGTDSFTVSGLDSTNNVASVSIVMVDFSLVSGTYTFDVDGFCSIGSSGAALNAIPYAVQNHGRITIDPTGKVTGRSGKLVFHGSFDEFGFFTHDTRPPVAGAVTVKIIVDSASGGFGVQTHLNAQFVENGLPGDYVFPVACEPIGQPGFLSGQYTLLFEPAGGASPPGGVGFGLMTVLPNGGITVAGRMGDGLPFSTSSALRNDQTFVLSQFAGSQNLVQPAAGSLPEAPFPYAYFTSNNGGVVSTVKFENKPNVSDLDGVLTYVDHGLFANSDGSPATYPNGVNASIQVIGSRFTPAPPAPNLFKFSNGSRTVALGFTGGNLPITEPLGIAHLAANNATASVNAPITSLSFLASSGASFGVEGMFYGTFEAGNTMSQTVFVGIVYQKGNYAARDFRNGTVTGTVTMYPQ